MKRGFILFLLVFCVLTVVPIVIMGIEALMLTPFENTLLGNLIDRLD